MAQGGKKSLHRKDRINMIFKSSRPKEKKKKQPPTIKEKERGAHLKKSRGNCSRAVIGQGGKVKARLFSPRREKRKRRTPGPLGKKGKRTRPGKLAGMGRRQKTRIPWHEP